MKLRVAATLAAGLLCGPAAAWCQNPNWNRPEGFAPPGAGIGPGGSFAAPGGPFAAPGGPFAAPGVFPDGPFPGPAMLPPGGAVLPPGPPVPTPVPPYGFGAFEQPIPLRDYSWLYIDAPQPREIKVHDIITIIVREQSQTTVDSRFNRNRAAILRAELREFMRLDDDFNLAPAAEDSPAIDGNLIGRLQSQGSVVQREGMIYRIAATVVDVLPNGQLVLEARKTIQSDDDLWEYSLTGELRALDVNRDNTALSENIANLRIVKRQAGRVRNSTRLPWGTRIYDWIFPF